MNSRLKPNTFKPKMYCSGLDGRQHSIQQSTQNILSNSLLAGSLKNAAQPANTYKAHFQVIIFFVNPSLI